jgi:hypothetical protein
MQDKLWHPSRNKMRKYYKLTNNKLHLVIVKYLIKWDCPFQDLQESKLIMI